MNYQQLYAPLDSVKLVWIDREQSTIGIQYTQLVNGCTCKGKHKTTQAEIMLHFMDILGEEDTILDLISRANNLVFKETFCKFLKEHCKNFAH